MMSNSFQDSFSERLVFVVCGSHTEPSAVLKYLVAMEPAEAIYEAPKVDVRPAGESGRDAA